MSDAKAYPVMSADEYRAALQRLGFANPEGRAWADTGVQAGGRFFGQAPRTARLWAERGPSKEAAMMLRLMAALDLDAAAVLALLDKPARAPAKKRKRG